MVLDVGGEGGGGSNDHILVALYPRKRDNVQKIVYVRNNSRHLTRATSRLLEQGLVTPRTLEGQCISLDSVPEHSTLYNQIRLALWILLEDTEKAPAVYVLCIEA